MKCRYEIHRCEQIPSYNHLERHEGVCDYQQKTWQECEKGFALKDFKSHKSTCPLITLTCPECDPNYKRQVQDKHTETKCLCEQLIQIKATVEAESNSLSEQLQELRTTVGRLENRCVTETVCSAETANNVPIIEESQN